MTFSAASARRDEVERFRLEPDDVLITKDSESWTDIGVPSVVEYSAPDLVSGYHLALLRPHRNRLLGGFLLRALQSIPVSTHFHISATGVTRYGLSHSAIKTAPLPLPPIPEQEAIVRYLDYVDRRIRRYIRAKQKLIKLLEEQKQAIIHRAVTRGLDPDARLKPSGVEWLGDVPEHWEVVALRLRYSQCLGKMLDSKRITGRHSVPYLRNTDVQWDSINTRALPFMDISPDEYSRYTVERGDLLVCEGGEVGRSAIWNGALALCGFQKALHRLRPLSSSRDLPRFLLHALLVASESGAFFDGHESTIGHLTGEKLRAHRFPFPDKAEQEAIVRFLDATSDRFDSAISSSHLQISLLREYRTRLIAGVVTGNLDVRDAAARLPDEPGEAMWVDQEGPLEENPEDSADDMNDTPENADT